ncbi:MAG: ADP-glyceromanno-heptose 6-epimerase [Bacteriodetes bacterium]|nr:ADP-glyceromanno-heptose 6-epimerase [Bacteroidota bacterium]
MIVVTGGAGFIGSCFIKKLNDEGVTDILVVDHFGTGDKWKNLVGKKFRTMIDKDAFMYGLEQGTFDEGVEQIVHLGACTKTTERDCDYLLENNYHYSIKIATHCINNDIRFIYASSAASYGLGEHGYDDRLFEQLKPLNMYGYSKHLFDLWVLQNGFDKRFTGIKYFNVFGPNEYHKTDMASMVYKAYLQIQDTGKVRLFKSTTPQYDNGAQQRDFVYVKDVVAVMWNMFKDTNFAGIYNLGTGNARSWNDLVRAVFTAMDKPVEIEYVDMPEYLKNQYQNYTQADMQKLNGTDASIQFSTLEESVGDYVRNYLMATWQHL